MGCGYTGNAVVLVLRDRAIKFFHEEPGRIEAYLRILEEIATNPKEEGSTRVAAVKELLMRGLGKAEQTINVKDGGGGKTTYSLDQLIEAVIAAGGNPDRFPMLAAHRRKQIEAKVGNPKEAP